MFSSLVLTCCIYLLSVISPGAHVLHKEHRTPAAEKEGNDLSCYHCSSRESGERCIHLPNSTDDFKIKCKEDKGMCMVKRYSIVFNTENVTSSPMLWMIQRDCVKHCQPGCLIIGERTKLHSCLTCCSKEFCNTGNSAECILHTEQFLKVFLLISTILAMFS